MTSDDPLAEIETAIARLRGLGRGGPGGPFGGPGPGGFPHGGDARGGAHPGDPRRGDPHGEPGAAPRGARAGSFGSDPRRGAHAEARGGGSDPHGPEEWMHAGPHGPWGAGPGIHRGPGRRGMRAAFLHGARHRLLEALESAGRALSVSELGAAIGVDQPRASRLVQAAVDDGFVRREADPNDARRTAIVLTDAGRAHLDEAREQRRGAVETALAGFNEEERTQFAALLTRFLDAWPR